MTTVHVGREAGHQGDHVKLGLHQEPYSGTEKRGDHIHMGTVLGVKWEGRLDRDHVHSSAASGITGWRNCSDGNHIHPEVHQEPCR